MNADAKFNLITRNLQEVLGAESVKDILTTPRNLSIYWGTATTGKPHIAYFLPLLKIKDFIDAGCKVKILLADIHGFLDNAKAPIELLSLRTLYYEKLIRLMLDSIGVNCDDTVEFVRGSSFQKSESYVTDLYRMATVTSERDAKKAGSEVVKQVSNPSLSSLLYPGMQALDEEYMDVDVQFGGVDQRKIFTFAMKYLPLIGYRKRAHFMNQMIDGLTSSGKMSSSDAYNKIDMIDSADNIRAKIRKSYCAEGNSNNGLFKLLQHVICPILKIKGLEISVRGVAYENFDDVRLKFDEKIIHPIDLKESVSEMIDAIVKPIRDQMITDLNLITDAYPHSTVM